MFPCILTSSVAALTFILPVESGEKVSLEITVLLSLAVFMLVVSESMPPSSDNFPIIGKDNPNHKRAILNWIPIPILFVKTTIVERKLNVFDCQSLLCGNDLSLFNFGQSKTISDIKQLFHIIDPTVKNADICILFYFSIIDMAGHV